MSKKKRKIAFFMPYFIALIALIAFGMLYFYVAKITILKTNDVLGIDDFKIIDVNYEKGYTVVESTTVPRLEVSYKTTREATTSVKINDKVSNPARGTMFSNEFIFDKDMFDKDLIVTINAVDKIGLQTSITGNVVIESPKQPKITIT